MCTFKTCFALTLIACCHFSQAAFHDDLAYHHAPIHYQDTDSTNYPAEYITAVDYDYDMISNNNWDNLTQGNLSAKVYYSVVESCSHYFITYNFFHPRDWVDTPFDGEHENDLEGVLFVVRKNNTIYGTLESMITVFHTDFFSFTIPGSSLTNGNENIDGNITFTFHDGSNRARTAQEAKGHGIKAWPYITNFTGATNQDGIVYYPSRTSSEVPSSGNDRQVNYQLISLFGNNGLWAQALHEANMSSDNSSTFHTWGTFKGNNSGGCGAGATFASCKSNAANTPWGWDDNNDSESYRGEFALDPAHLTDHYFNNLGNFSHKYINNRFAQDLQQRGYNSGNLPRGYADTLNLNQVFQKLGNSCP